MSSYLLQHNPGTRQYAYPRRGGAQLSGTAIIHTAECAVDNDGEDLAAENCANFIATRADYGSYHRLVDSDSIIDMLPFEYEAWQDSETNNWAVGICAALRTSDWLTMPADRADRVYRNLSAAAAEFVQYMASKGVNVPLRRLTGAEARARVPGFCAHGDSGVSRSDPGAAFDWARFFEYTRQAINGTNIQEDDMPITDADAVKIADIILDRQRGGNTLGQVVAEKRPHQMDTVRLLEALPDRIMDLKRGGSTLGETVAENRPHHLEVMAGFQGIKTGGTLDVAELAKALAEQLPKQDAKALLEALGEILRGGGGNG